MIWSRLKCLWPAWRRREERERREDLGSLIAIAGLGNLTLAMEDVRASSGWTRLGSIRYSLRALRRQPAFVAVAVLWIALAIGAKSAIFSLAQFSIASSMKLISSSPKLEAAFSALTFRPIGSGQHQYAPRDIHGELTIASTNPKDHASTNLPTCARRPYRTPLRKRERPNLALHSACRLRDTA
jgi:hypothetical protein